MTAVKICGVCAPEDARMATVAGAAFIGVILAPGRSRTRTCDEAAAIYDASDARRVGVFVDATFDEIREAVRRLRLDVVQLHGDEAPSLLERLRDAADVAVWKAVRVRAAGDVAHAGERYAAVADALLLDGWAAHAHGGTGARFDWTSAAPARFALPGDLRIVVAGGLAPGNVADAVVALAPDVVDVSSGVEETPGRKSAARVDEFMAAVRGAGKDA